MFTDFFWDFDGTLFNTYPRMARAVLRGMEDHGISADLDWILRNMKVSLAFTSNAAAEKYGITPENVIAGYRLHAEDEGVETIIPYSGAFDALRLVAESGGRNYLYTHRNNSAIQALEYYGVSNLFYDVITAEDGFPAKPAPDALCYLGRKHDLSFGKCIMIGDRPIDFEAGKNAGMSSALFDPEGFYPDYPAEYRFSDFDTMMQNLI